MSIFQLIPALIGLVLGVVASFINKSMGMGIAIFSGILGAYIGALVFIKTIGISGSFALIGPILGASLLLLIVHLVKSK